jgi:hypothetical protein
MKPIRVATSESTPPRNNPAATQGPHVARIPPPLAQPFPMRAAPRAPAPSVYRPDNALPRAGVARLSTPVDHPSQLSRQPSMPPPVYQPQAVKPVQPKAIFQSQTLAPRPPVFRPNQPKPAQKGVVQERMSLKAPQLCGPQPAPGRVTGIQVVQRAESFLPTLLTGAIVYGLTQLRWPRSASASAPAVTTPPVVTAPVNAPVATPPVVTTPVNTPPVVTTPTVPAPVTPAGTLPAARPELLVQQGPSLLAICPGGYGKSSRVAYRFDRLHHGLLSFI